MRRPPVALAAWALVAGGCAFQWDSAAPQVTTVGEMPSLAALPRLNHLPSGTPNLMLGEGNVPWASFCEFSAPATLGGRSVCRRVHLARLDGAPGDEILDGEGFIFRFRAIYYYPKQTPTPPRGTPVPLVLHTPGAPARDVQFQVPAGNSLIYINSGAGDDVFVHWWIDPSTRRFTIYRRDGRYQRNLAVPEGVNPAAPQSTAGFELLLTRDGDTLVLRKPDGGLLAYSTLDETTVHLGKRPPSFLLDDDRRRVLTVGKDGLRSLPVAGGAERILDPLPVERSTLSLAGGAAYYLRDQALHRVPLDGSAPPEVVQREVARLLAVGPRGELVHSRDPATRYTGSAGDGWLGPLRVMERGRRLRFGAGGAKVRFLEYAAQPGTVGDLTMVPLPGEGPPPGPPVVLAWNARTFDELADGRLAAIENRVYAGTWNRLVLIDEERLEKRWVIPGATEFFLVPGGRAVVGAVVTDADRYDVVLAPIPPR